MAGRPFPALSPLLLLPILSACPEPEADVGAPATGAATVPGSDDKVVTQPEAARFRVDPAEGVRVSGTFVYDGEKEGHYRLDFLQQEGNQPPKLVHTLEIQAPGPWEIVAPKGFGPLKIVGFVDVEGDGPSPDDPAGVPKEPVVVGEEDVRGIEVVVTDDPELGAFAPGASPGAPPEPGAQAPSAAEPSPASGAPPTAPGGAPAAGDAAPSGQGR